MAGKDMNDWAPADFEVYVGGFAGPAYGLWWDGKQLVYESFGPGYQDRCEAHIVPSSAQWSRFWQTMETLDVWAWGSRYEPAARYEPADVIRDGTHWSITLSWRGRRVVSSGDGAGPDDADLDSSRNFTCLCDAVSRLAGGVDFS
jgi:hypothetical protein